MTVRRETVELVDESGYPMGEATVQLAHTPPGQLHRAFSVMLFDEHDRVLLQQRAHTKSRFPGLWANTCCSHPAPGETITESAARRIHEELGLTSAELAEIGTFIYHALDGYGAAEYEFDHVLIGRLDTGSEITVQPDPAEIVQLQWVDYRALAEEVAATPEKFAPWLPGVLEVINSARAQG